MPREAAPPQGERQAAAGGSSPKRPLCNAAAARHRLLPAAPRLLAPPGSKGISTSDSQQATVDSWLMRHYAVNFGATGI